MAKRGSTGFFGIRQPLVQRVVKAVALLIGLTIAGTLGFRLVSGGRWLDCLYMAVITLTTVGYGEAVPLGDAGRVFVIVYLATGFGIFTYTALQVGQLLVSGELRLLLEKRRMELEIGKLSGHHIVCGLGRMGLTICRHLQERQKPFVVIDSNEARLRERCSEENWLYLAGDATDDAVLLKGGIDRALSLASVLPTDADNVYVILSARLLSSKLEIISRASNEKAAAKMERAGANRVVSPFSTGALKIARFMVNPDVEDFLDIADRHGLDVELVAVEITAGSPYLGKPLQETDLSRLGVIVVGIRRTTGEQLMPPPPATKIQAGDCLFAFGNRGAVNRMVAETEREV